MVISVLVFPCRIPWKFHGVLILACGNLYGRVHTRCYTLVHEFCFFKLFFFIIRDVVPCNWLQPAAVSWYPQHWRGRISQALSTWTWRGSYYPSTHASRHCKSLLLPMPNWLCMYSPSHQQIGRSVDTWLSCCAMRFPLFWYMHYRKNQVSRCTILQVRCKSLWEVCKKHTAFKLCVIAISKQ